jgi:hypothetical protein
MQALNLKTKEGMQIMKERNIFTWFVFLLVNQMPCYGATSFIQLSCQLSHHFNALLAGSIAGFTIKIRIIYPLSLIF